MKHIKTKKTFESLTDKVKSFFTIPSRESIEDVKDICLELTDEGYVVDISDDYVICTILIYSKTSLIKSKFNYEDIKETVERLQSYLGEKIQDKLVFTGWNGWINFDEMEKMNVSNRRAQPWSAIKIKFKI